MIKYRTRFNKIETVEIVRETDKMVVLCSYERGCDGSMEYREAKRSDWSNWFDSFEDAKAFLIEEAESKVASAQAALESAQAKLAQARALRDDQPK